MGRSIDYDQARSLLASIFEQAERRHANGGSPNVPESMQKDTALLFASKTQAFREALIGCALARILDPEIDITKPYMNQSDNAFSGRTLDERVVNPFLRDKEVPCSSSPYLSALRRNVDFTEDTARGLRDRQSFFAMLNFIKALRSADEDQSKTYLEYLLLSFLKLRDSSQIRLSRVRRLSVDQYDQLIAALLKTPSGGLLPVLLSVAMFQTLRDCFSLPWEIEWQGINVADRATGVGGDITIKRESDVVLAVEVTERPIERQRVVSTFNTKISPQGLEDYLFFFGNIAPTEEAKSAANQYFAQGHDINFLPVKDWIVIWISSIGTRCRNMYIEKIIGLLDGNDVPAALKVAWNNHVRNLSQGLST